MMLRHRLVLAFLAASLLPLAATIWITTSLLDRSLGYATTAELDRVSRTLEGTARLIYQQERDALKREVLSGRLTPTRYPLDRAVAWPEPVRAFWSSGELERFGLSGEQGDHVDWLRRASAADAVEVFSRDLRGIRMEALSAEFRRTRATIAAMESRDLRRGFTLTLLLLVAVVWLVSLAPLVFIARRISLPVQQLTAGLTAFAAGDWERRVQTHSSDEVGRAVQAFNAMAEQLRQNRDRLVYLTQVASWQSLARKTAHELKNSLTPIRLTVEEMLARQPPGADRLFMEQAGQIVVGEIDTLERRVRAFSEFAGEPAVQPERIDLNTLVSERLALIKAAHPHLRYECRLASPAPPVFASADLVKGIVTNLLQNAAEAAGAAGRVLVVSASAGRETTLEIHDSGSGLSDEARSTLFEPTITFKRGGMGLGLSIAKRHALLCGGDLALVDGCLAGAAFRVTLPAEPPTP